MRPDGVQGIRVRLQQTAVLPGRPVDNARIMCDSIATARSEQVDLLVFPEMAIPGYLLADEWERESFLRECEACGHDVAAACGAMTVVFGNVAIDWNRRNEDGRVRKYNAAFVVDQGVFQGAPGSPYPFVAKTLMPNYREFDDSRHFYDARKLALEVGCSVSALLQPVPTSRGRLGCLICEDAWDTDYGLSPLRILAEQGADMLINISASPFTENKNHKRHRVFAAHARAMGRPLFFVNHVGLQDNGKTVFAFEGASAAYDAGGRRLDCEPLFKAGCLDIDLPADHAAPFGEDRVPRPDSVDDLRAAIEYGIAGFMARCGVERVVVGVSGGVDSALVAALYRRLLPPERLLLVSMPGPYTSAVTRRLASDVAAGLGCLFLEAPIDASVAETLRQLHDRPVASLDGRVHTRLMLDTVAIENVQARDRSARILAACASAFGGVFTCNANKAEATVGYTTLYGDLGGYLAAIADLWKQDVYAMARNLNTLADRPIIPTGCLDVPPSAELSAAQSVERGQGDPLIYPYHDKLFASWVERWNRATPEDCLEWYAKGKLAEQIGYDGNPADLFPTAERFVADLERWWNCYQGLGVAKRIQAPPVLAVKRRAFGFDHRESQLGPRYTRQYETLKRTLLGT